MMEPIFKRDIIRGARDRWNRQYARSGAQDKLEISRRLAPLDLNTCQGDDVDVIIGNSSWTDNKCDACDTDCEVLIRIGEEPDYEARWQDLCAECLGRAQTLLAAAIRQGPLDEGEKCDT